MYSCRICLKRSVFRAILIIMDLIRKIEKNGVSSMSKLKNNSLFLLYTVILGAFVGLIVWSFLRVMNLGIEFLWKTVPSRLDFPLYTLCVCTVGGLLTGLWKRKFGDYPEELSAVMGTVKKTGRYPYHNVFSTLGSALFPLLWRRSLAYRPVPAVFL